MLDPDAAEQAAKKLVAHRITCRDRTRATRALLKQMKPALFEKKHRLHSLNTMRAFIQLKTGWLDQ